ncbi:MAG: right-handed parallel beta-helix repeat-containing protein [Patescibacteria group bacterium]|jgi:hypothetical protein
MTKTTTKVSTRVKVAIGVGVLGLGLAAAGLVGYISEEDKSADADKLKVPTYYVNPSDPDAYPLPTGVVAATAVSSGYGTVDKPFSGINSAIAQVRNSSGYDSTKQTRIIVAPSVYHETINLGSYENFTIIADQSGTMTHTSPGEVIIDGGEPLDETKFIAVSGYTNVYEYANVLNSSDINHFTTNAASRSICFSESERGSGQSCALDVVAESNSSYKQLPYSEKSSLADVESTPGSYYVEVTENHSSADDILNLYIHTYDSTAPNDAVHGIETTPILPSGMANSEGWMFHRHCFDLEDGAKNISVNGFTCRYTWSMGMHVRSSSKDTIRGNKIYGIGDVNIAVNNDTTYDDSTGRVNILANTLINPLSAGIKVYGYSNVLIENNLIYNINQTHSYGISIGGISEAHSEYDIPFVPTIFIANNTVNGMYKGVSSYTGIFNFVSVNNTVSNSSSYNYFIKPDTGGTVVLDHNNWYGSTNGYGATTWTETNLKNVDPGFMDATNYDFRLTLSSLLRDQGTAYTYGSYSTPTNDFSGKARDASPDIGAYELPPVK